MYSPQLNADHEQDVDRNWHDPSCGMRVGGYVQRPPKLLVDDGRSEINRQHESMSPIDAASRHIVNLSHSDALLEATTFLCKRLGKKADRLSVRSLRARLILVGLMLAISHAVAKCVVWVYRV